MSLLSFKEVKTSLKNVFDGYWIPGDAFVSLFLLVDTFA